MNSNRKKYTKLSGLDYDPTQPMLPDPADVADTAKRKSIFQRLKFWGKNKSEPSLTPNTISLEPTEINANEYKNHSKTESKNSDSPVKYRSR